MTLCLQDARLEEKRLEAETHRAERMVDHMPDYDTHRGESPHWQTARLALANKAKQLLLAAGSSATKSNQQATSRLDPPPPPPASNMAAVAAQAMREERAEKLQGIETNVNVAPVTETNGDPAPLAVEEEANSPAAACDTGPWDSVSVTSVSKKEVLEWLQGNASQGFLKEHGLTGNVTTKAKKAKAVDLQKAYILWGASNALKK